ncbi:MAG: acyl-CoA dehydrogenase, partial [Actinomycetota bacterium]
MNHFRSNLRDLEFTLFEVHRLGSYSEELVGLDGDTARQLLREVERLASGVWADSFVEADRTDLHLRNGEVTLPPSLKKSLEAFWDGGWARFGLAGERGGTPGPHLLGWAT